MAYDGSIKIDTSIDGSGFSAGLKSLGSMAAKGLAAVTGSLTALGGAAIKIGADFEASMSEVAAISGASAEQLDALTEKAKEMGAVTKFSASESAEALKYMAMAGWDTQAMLDGLPGVMNLAAASGEDLALVSDIVTDAMTAFGLQAQESAHFADVLAKASSSSNTNVAMMGETFKYVAPIAGSLGYSIEDTAVAIGLMANSGIKGSQAGTALRSVLTRLAKPPKEAAEAIKALGLEMTDAEGQMLPLSEVMGQLRTSFKDLTQEQKVQMAAALGGQEAMSGLLAIVNASEEDYQKLVKQINNANGAAQEQAEIMQDNLKGAIEELGGAAETLGIQVYESVQTPLRDIVDDATEMVNGMSKAFEQDGLSGLLNELGSVFADVATLAAEAAPAMVEAAVRFIQSFVDGIAANKNRILDAAKSLVFTLADGIASLLPKEIQEPIKDMIKDIQKSLESGGLKKGINSVKKFITELGKVIGDVAKAVLPLFTKALDLVAGNLDTIIPLATTAIGIFKGWKALQTVAGYLSTLTKGLGSAVSAVGKFVGSADGIGASLTKAGSSISGFAGSFGKVFGSAGILTAGVTAAISIGKAISDNLDRPMREAAEAAQENAARIEEAYSEVAAGIAEKYTQISQAAETAGTLFDGVTSGLILDDKKIAEIDDGIAKAQERITEIARAASEERRGLTNAEVEEINTLLERITGLTKEKAEEQEAYAKAAYTRVKMDAEAGEITAENYQKSMNTITEAFQSGEAAAEASYNNQLATIEKMIGTSDEYTEEWAAEKRKAAKADYEATMAEQTRLANDSLAILSNSLFGQLDIASVLSDERNRAIERANDEHTERLLEIDRKYSEKALNSKNAYYDFQAMKDREIEAENTRHKNEINSINSSAIEDLSAANQEKIAAAGWLINETVANNLELTEEEKRTAKAIVDAFRDEQGNMTDAGKKLMESLSWEIDKYGNILYIDSQGNGRMVVDGLESVTGSATLTGPVMGDIRNVDKSSQDALNKAQRYMNNNPITMIANVATKIKGMTAHAAGGVITKPLVSGQHLFGEAGPEAVLPLRRSVYDALAGSIVESMRAAVRETQSRPIQSIPGQAAWQGITSGNLSATIVVPVSLDGREVARVTAPYMGEQLAWEG